MSNTAAPNANGRKRMTLNEQIERLDTMLDGLSEGLNEAVATAVNTAVGTAVQQAVQTVLTEVLTNADLLAKFQAPTLTDAPAEPPPSPPTVWQRLRHLLSGLRDACVSGARRFYARLKLLAPFKSLWLTAAAMGTGVGTTLWFAGGKLAAFLGGIGAFGSAIAVQVGGWFRRMTGLSHEVT